jgi:quercetin dioxygenase-like cupin family protein
MYETKTDTSALAWSPTGWPGVSMKMLQQVESSDGIIGGMIGMMRMEAGSSIPAHSHTHAARLSSPKSDQAVFVIEGDLVEDGVTYGPGSFLLAKAGTPHGPHSSSGGCVLLSTYFGKPDFVPVG